MQQILWNPQHVRATPEHESACAALRDVIGAGKRPALSIVLDQRERKRAQDAAAGLSRFDRVLVFGTGGSSLGGQALLRLKPGAKVDFVDNVDPHTMDNLLATCIPETTGALIISKSGGTLETLSQAYVFTHFMEQRLGREALAKHFVCLVEDTDNPLRQLAQTLGLPFYALSPEIGGRFCVFSLVGLVPGLLAGLDMDRFCEGAAGVLNGFLNEDPLLSTGLAFQHAQMKQGVSQHVVMAYSDALFTYAQWAQQLIGESLGKQGKGVTPQAARGTVDQHSQLQLYMDGPLDKWFTFITCADTKRGPVMDAPWISPQFSYLQGKTIGDVMVAEHQATLMALAQAGRPVRELAIDRPTEATLGALMMQCMLEVMLLAHVMGVNPFDQPAVETGKIIAKERLSRG
jgi:glucose-6-phosphate isomerase